jgi:hypothetical protein
VSLDEDMMEELREQQEWHERRRRNATCANGYCGADDCPKCRPGSYRFATGEEDDMADLKDAPAVKIEINCICGRPLEAVTYIDNGLIKLVVAPCRCGDRRPG